jgi:hypothetical protein
VRAAAVDAVGHASSARESVSLCTSRTDRDHASCYGSYAPCLLHIGVSATYPHVYTHVRCSGQTYAHVLLGENPNFRPVRPENPALPGPVAGL